MVYHITCLPNAVNITKEDKISLSPALLGAGADNTDNKRFFFLSTTRSKGAGPYAEKALSGGRVCFVLDGDRLNADFKGRPYAYWSNRDHDRRMIKNEFGGYDTSMNEMEDRIVSDKPYINNFSRYVKSVDVLVEEGQKLYDKEKYMIYKIISYYGYPRVRVYNNKRDYLRGTDNTITEKGNDIPVDR